MITIDHWLQAPLCYQITSSPNITIYAREFRFSNEPKPYLVYLQGGPGFQAPRNVEELAWFRVLCKHYHIILLDQRGTGKSTPVDYQTPSQFASSHDLATYLSHFRADNIVRDCEQLREKCIKVAKWTILGQSFGGFISVCYLSLYPESLKQVYITGGLPPLPHHTPLKVYQKLNTHIINRNQRLYQTYPELLKTVARIYEKLPYTLPDGTQLTQTRFQSIGHILGKTRGLETTKTLLTDAFTDPAQTQLQWDFIKQVAFTFAFDTNPLYAVLHESIYCHQQASNWAADTAISKLPPAATPYFYAETIQRSLFDEYLLLKPFKAAAKLLATKKNWPTLYQIEQLSRNTVPITALVYADDYFVDMDFSLETAGLIPHCQVWLHPTWQHDGLRSQGLAVATGLLQRS